jgi:hypothetical protein
MVQPINYTIPVADPFESLTRGMNLGLQMEQVQAARQRQALQSQQMQAEMEVARQKAEQQRRSQEALSAYFAKPFEQRTSADIESLLPFLPKEQFASLIDVAKTRSDEQNATTARLYGQMGTAIRSGSPEVAARLARERSQAETNPEQKRAFEGLAQAIEKAPQQAFEILSIPMVALGGPYAEAAKKMFEIAGPKAQAELGFEVLTSDEAKRRGLPTSGYTWQINRKTDDVSALVKPPQAPVQVNLPGQPAPPTALQKQIDEKFAPVAVQWLSGERAQATSRIRQLDAVVNVLDTKKRVTGPVLGITPDVVLSFVNPQSREARANAERIIQEGLRATLGAQFTQKEGEAFLSRAFDPKAPQDDNARRLRAIVGQMKTSAADRQSMVDYMQGSGQGSLVGYRGRIPSINDFYDAIEEKPPASQKPPAGARTQPAAKGTDIGGGFRVLD